MGVFTMKSQIKRSRKVYSFQSCFFITFSYHFFIVENNINKCKMINSKTNQAEHVNQKIREKKPHVKLKTNLSSKHFSKEGMKKSVKKEKSQKKNIPQLTSKKQLQLRSNYYDREGLIKTKKTDHDYYNQKGPHRKNKKISQSHHQQIHTERSSNYSGQFGVKHMLKSTDQIKKVESISDFNKLRIYDSKGVITFDGKLVKVSPRFSNFPCTTSFANYTDGNEYGEYEGDRKSKKKRKQSSRLEKARSCKTKSKSKSKSKNKKRQQSENNKKVLKKSVGVKFSNSTLARKCKNEKSFQLVDTQPTPNINILIEKKEIINIEEIRKEIEEALAKQQKRNVGKSDIQERMKCLKMISKICGVMEFRKESYSLAVALFDKYLDNLYVSIVELNKIALTCLILAVKHEEANRNRQFLFELLNLNTLVKQRQLLRRSLSGGRKKLSQGRASTSKGKVTKQEKKKRKKENLRFKRIQALNTIIAQTFGQYEKVKKNELMQLENLILSKLGFKVMYRTYIEWTDAFTIIWDQKITEKSEDEKLLFRGPKSFQNFYITIKVIEAAHYDPRVYNYSEIVLVLSVMYLLVRILMEGDMREGCDSYKKVLKKSSNSLFIDKAGSNQLFGQFLQSLSLQMGQILHCCQYVSQYLFHQFITDYNLLKIHPQLILSIHIYNPGIYDYLTN